MTEQRHAAGLRPFSRGRGSRQARTLLAVQQRRSPTPYVADRVQVRVIREAAGHALECPGAP